MPAECGNSQLSTHFPSKFKYLEPVQGYSHRLFPIIGVVVNRLDGHVALHDLSQ